MENLNDMGKRSLESLSRDDLTDKSRRRIAVDMTLSVTALICLVAGAAYSRLFPEKSAVATLIYLAGILIEFLPVAFTALRGIFSRDLTNAMEVLVAIAIVACYFDGQYALAILIPVILNIVHFLEERSIMGGRDILDGLRSMRTDTVVLISEDGHETEVDAKTLKVGQTILLRPGCGIPIDGCVTEGGSNIDEKSLTGEAIPKHVGVGDRVFAGTLNIDGVIRVRVEQEYVDSSFSKILSLLEKAEQISLPQSRLIDKFMGYYIPLILSIAAAVALIDGGISRAIAILVVSCPCGEMLISSAPMIAALGVATRRGILIKNSKFIEQLTEVDTVVFDKTGTLTEGDLRVAELMPFGEATREELISAAASVAHGSLHPVSRAIMSVAGEEVDRTLAITEQSGRGMRGVAPDTEVLFGNPAWISEQGYELPPHELQGTVNAVVKNGTPLGYISFDDSVRKDARLAVHALSELGITHSVMLTGDREAAASRIAAEVGVSEVRAELMPEEKYKIVESLRADGGRVLVIGDGINDALALKEADIGIAMGAMGSDTAIQSADIALMNNRLENIPFAVGLSKLVRRIIYQNTVIAFSISFIMIALSAAGIISALAGALLHNAGAFAVLLNSSRIIKRSK